MSLRQRSGGSRSVSVLLIVSGVMLLSVMKNLRVVQEFPVPFFQAQEGAKILRREEQSLRSPTAVPKDDSFSACLLMMDDNHYLIEWLAYHYHMLPLRHLIVAVDPKSKTSPSGIFDRWHGHGIRIDLWSEEEYMPEEKVGMNMSNLTAAEQHGLYLFRQRTFYNKCMRELKALNRTWTLLIDTDEYLMINTYATSRFKVSTPSIEQPASVLTFIQQELAKDETKLPKESPCIMIPRLRYGSKESEPEEVMESVPEGFNASTFLTLRFRKHAPILHPTLNRFGKVIIDVSRVNDTKIDVQNPHRPLPDYCPLEGLYTRIKDNLFVVHHYTGTWEQFFFRDDCRASKSDENFNRYHGLNLSDDGSIRPWLKGFIRDKGADTAAALLKDAGHVPRNAANSNTRTEWGCQ